MFGLTREERLEIAEDFKYPSKASPGQPCGFNMKVEFRRVTVMTRHGGCEAIDLLAVLFCPGGVKQEKSGIHTLPRS